MHPRISDSPKMKFYKNELKDGLAAKDRKWEGIHSNPVYCWDTGGKYHESAITVDFNEDFGYIYVNAGEIDLVVEVIINLIHEKGASTDEIGVITPYSGQRDLLSKFLVKNEFIIPTNDEVKVEDDRDDIDDEYFKPIRVHFIRGIMIASNDALQGPENSIGFLE